MKRTHVRRFNCLKLFYPVICVLILRATAPGAQTRERFFDTAKEPHANVRLTIFYPSVGTLKALLALKEQGLLISNNMEVVGVYHSKEKTKYEESRKLVRDMAIPWIKFHELSAELGAADLFRRNALSGEFQDIFSKSDGIIFFGGPDIQPAVYGQKTNFLTRIEDPYRHYFELSFAFHLLGGLQNEAFMAFLEKRRDFPVLGICLCCQTLNVVTGGTMVQDVWADTYGMTFVEDIISMGQPNWHTNPWPRLDPLDRNLIGYMLHPIRLMEKSKFCTELGFKPSDEPYIMSAHHQATDKIGKGFLSAAASLDGKVVEAIEHTRFTNVLGVQFHPEFPILWDSEPRWKFMPQDKELIGIKPYLEAHVPSMEFHKKLWRWFFEKLRK